MAGRPRKNAEIVDNDEYLTADYILDSSKNIINVSPALDLALSGGVPESVIAILSAPAKVGKTSLALKIAAKGQKQYGKTVIYVSVENRLSQKNLQGTKGLDLSPDRFKIIGSTKGSILSCEQILEKTERALSTFPGSVLIFDSFSALSSSAERTGKYGEGFGNVSARKMEGEFARRISPIVQVNDNIVIGIAHVTPNLNMPGNSVKISKAIMYQMDINLSMKKCYPQGDWTSGDRVVGQKVNVDVLTSALGAPGMSCTCFLKYGFGYSDEAEVASLAQDLSLVEKNGTWLSIPKFEVKAQGMDQLITLLEERQDIFSYLNDQIKEIMK